MRPIKVEFIVDGKIAFAFKQKFPELKAFSNKQLINALIKDEFFRAESLDFFDVKFYNNDDIKEIFKL